MDFTGWAGTPPSPVIKIDIELIDQTPPSPLREILLVEDDPAHAELIRRAFEERGHSFHLSIAETITKAREHIREHHPDLIIADWMLPDGHGTELIEQENHPESIPVVIMTSHGNERVAVEALKAGALDYIVKSDSTFVDMPHIVARALREWDNQIHRKLAEQELRRRVFELETINRISAALRTALRKDEILERLLNEVLGCMDSQVGMIWLYQNKTSKLYPVRGRGWLVEAAKEPLEYGRCIAGFVFVSGKIHISESFIHDALAEEGAAKSFPPGWGGIWLPIQTADRVVGVMLIAFPAPHQVSEDEIHLLTTIADIAGNAIHRANLYEQTERNLNRLNALHTIDIAITASTELSLSLNVLLTQALLLLEADAAVILKVNPLLQMLEFLAEKGFPSPAIQRTHLRLGQGYAGQAAMERRLIGVPDASKALKDGNRMESLRSRLFHAYHAMPLVARGNVKGVLEIFHRHPFRPDNDWLETLEALAGQAALAIENAELFEKLEKSNLQLRMAYDDTIEGWSRALEMRGHESHGHTRQVAEMSVNLARLMGFQEEDLIHIRRGALLHDIGKMAIPDHILTKTEPLTEEEWKIMRQHPVYARSMLASIEYLRPALDIPYYHHERWDGSGYPEGLSGEQIPLAARIFSVVEVWDVLRAERPYRSSWPAHEIEKYLQAQSGRLFDPQVVKIFLQKVVR